MQEIYILIKSEGIYDSQTSSPVAAFMDKEAAEKECKRLNNEMDDLYQRFYNLFGSDDADEKCADFVEFLENRIAIKILKAEHPDYYDFYIKTDGLCNIDNDNQDDLELSNEIYCLIDDIYLNDADKLCKYAKESYKDIVLDKIKVYVEYKNKCSYGDFYEGLPSYYVTDESIPLYN